MAQGAQNGLVGEESPLELPQTQLDTDSLVEERKMARFSKTAEYEKLKEHLQSRIEYYQRFLPGSTDTEVTAYSSQQLGEAWRVATAVIAEFEAVLAAYELAAQAVSDDARQKAS